MGISGIGDFLRKTEWTKKTYIFDFKDEDTNENISYTVEVLYFNRLWGIKNKREILKKDIKIIEKLAKLYNVKFEGKCELLRHKKCKFVSSEENMLLEKIIMKNELTFKNKKTKVKILYKDKNRNILEEIEEEDEHKIKRLGIKDNNLDKEEKKLLQEKEIEEEKNLYEKEIEENKYKWFQFTCEGVKIRKRIRKFHKVRCYHELKLESFKNKRIAIDFLNWFFTYVSIAREKILKDISDYLTDISDDNLFEAMLEEAIKFNNKLMKHNITPVWIWDGESQNNKSATKIERRKKREAEIEKMKKIGKELENMNILQRPQNMIDEYIKLKARSSKISPSIFGRLKKIFIQFGLPVLTSNDEAENLGSSLVKEKKISALWTADTDTYPLECPLVVKGFKWKNGVEYIESVLVKNIYEDLDLTPEEFRLFCIKLGTDFNERMAGVGPQACFKIIKEYGDDYNKIINETKHGFHNNDYKKIIPQLTPYKTNYNKKDLYIKNVDLNQVQLKEDIFEENYMQDFIGHLRRIREC